MKFFQPIVEEDAEKLLGIHQECAGESGVDEEIIKKALEGDFPDDDNFKKHIVCMGKKIGFLNEDGEPQVEVIQEELSKHMDNAKEVVETCIEDKGSPEDLAFNFIKCSFKLKQES